MDLGERSEAMSPGIKREQLWIQKGFSTENSEGRKMVAVHATYSLMSILPAPIHRVVTIE